VIQRLLLTHICGHSDESICELWVHDSYFQYFTREALLQHGFPHERGLLGAIKREQRRRSAIKPVSRHMVVEGHLGRCYLKGTAGDAADAIVPAVDHNLRLIVNWLRMLLGLILAALRGVLADDPILKLAS
jgi:hypothetical protein